MARPVAETTERVFETSFLSSRNYDNPFADVEVDAIFEGHGRTWRVPAFWRGGAEWGVRFAPDIPGEYRYRLECDDLSNPGLSGQEGRVRISAYTGTSDLLRRGNFRVSPNGRYFQHADGTPFYWLGDTWYTSLSDRLPWDGFQTLVADRVDKGFTAITVAISTCSNEERAPLDSGFHNEGGFLWAEDFSTINPAYFDYADRRIEHLVENNLAPVIWGSWFAALFQPGFLKLKKYWRYIVGRYGIYPVFWVAAGETNDWFPMSRLTEEARQLGGWSEILAYIREIDPYAHPLTTHEFPPPLDSPLSDESLTDFDMFQPGHFGWDSLAAEVAQLNLHRARTDVAKPLVVAEVGWETIGSEHYEDFQRTAFWLAMVNGAAGYTYGNAMVAEAYTADKPLHRCRFSLLTWDEAMHFPGARQIAISSRLLRDYEWYEFEPHPEWVTPRGTTLLEPKSQSSHFNLQTMRNIFGEQFNALFPGTEGVVPVDAAAPLDEWERIKGNVRAPYAAGIPRRTRVVFTPTFGFTGAMRQLPPPTILGLEEGVCYRAFYFDTSLGVKFDLGTVTPPPPGEILCQGKLGEIACRSVQEPNAAMIEGIEEADVVVEMQAPADADFGIVVRYRGPDNYVLATFTISDRELRIIECRDGVTGPPLAAVEVGPLSADARLNVEARDAAVIASISDGPRSTSSPIVNISAKKGAVGVVRPAKGIPNPSYQLEVRRCAAIPQDLDLERKLYDAAGRYRGELAGGPWENYGRKRLLLQNAYRPESPPFFSDWILVLHASDAPPEAGK